MTPAQRAASGAAARRHRATAWLPWILAVGGGVLWGLQFGRQGNLLTPWWSLAPFLWLLSYRRAGRLGWVHGIATWTIALWWIVPTLRQYGDLHPLIATAGLAILGLIFGFYHALAARLAAGAWRHGGLPAWLGPAAIWVCCEWLRSHLLSGLPWNLTGYAWVAIPGALPLTAWVGTYGLSFLVVFANTGVALAAVRRRWEPLAVGVLLPLAILAPAARWASVDQQAADAGVRSPELRPVRLIQPNIPNRVPFDWPQTQADYGRLIDMSRRACNEPGALLIWPESAAFPFILGRDPQLDRDVAALNRAGCSVLLNNPAKTADGRWFNSALLISPGAEPARYDKLHLVPFGEYVPLRGMLSFFDSLTRNAGDFTAAEEPVLLPWGDERLGLSICYEVAFPEEVAQRVRQGATLLVTITNDAWYGDTFAPWQHFRAARFRAAENRRLLLRAAITGVSGVIGPDGSVRSRSAVEETITLQTSIHGRTDLSPYTRRPWLVPLLCLLVAVGSSRRGPLEEV